MATPLVRAGRLCQHLTRHGYARTIFLSLSRLPANDPGSIPFHCLGDRGNFHGMTGQFSDQSEQLLHFTLARPLTSVAENLPSVQDEMDEVHSSMAGNVSSVQDEIHEGPEGHSNSSTGQDGLQVENELLEVDSSTVFVDESHVDEVALRLRTALQKLNISESGDLADSEVLAKCTQVELFERMSFLQSVGVVGKQLADLAFLHPSLLSLDLVKGLTPAFECMKSFGLSKSVLGEVLVVDPGLAELLIERAFEDRIQALQDLGFSTDDIAALLRSLTRRQFGQLVRLPVEKLAAVLSFLTNLSSKSAQAIKAVKNAPTILFKDIKEDFESKVKVVDSIFDETKRVRKIFASFPELLGRKTETIEETVVYFTSLVGDIKELKKLIENSPVVLTYSKRAIQHVVEYLQSIGFESRRAAALLAQQPYLITCEIKRLEKHVEFLKSKALDEQAICTLMENSPIMFTRSIEKRVAPKIEFLESQGIVGENLLKFILARPQVCRKSLRNTMAPNLKFLLELGFQENSAVLRGALKATLPHSCKTMRSRINQLVGLGIEHDKVCKMVRESPSILVMTRARIEKRVDFLVNTMKRPVQELATCPSFLVLNLENTIQPRVRVLEWLKSQGRLEKDLSLSTIVEITEESFVKQFVEPHVQVSAIYRGTPKQV